MRWIIGFIAALMFAPVANAAPADDHRLWDVVCEQFDQGMSSDQIIQGFQKSMPGHSESDWLLLLNYATINNCSEYYQGT